MATFRALLSLALGLILAGSSLVLVQGQAPPRDASIAIIGGGVHGLLLANELSRAGYSRLTVFESSREVVPIACTVELGGEAYDCSITIWPADNFEDGAPLGPPTNAVELLQQANTTFAPPQLVAYMDTDTGSREVLPPFLQAAPGAAAINISDIPVQLLKVYTWLYELNQHPHTPLGVIQSGLALSNETFGEWVERQGVSIYLSIEDYKYKATVTGADVGALPAAVVLNLARLYPSVIKVALYTLGQDPDDPAVPAPLREGLKACQDSAGEECYFWVALPQGHRRFFENLTEALPDTVDVRTSTAAVSVRPTPNGGVIVAYDAAGQPGEEMFDRAVMAVRAADAQQMLHPDAPAMRLYNAVALGGHPQLRTLLTHGFVYELNESRIKQGAENSGGSSAAGLVGSQLLQGGGSTSFAGYTVPVDLPHLVNGTPSSAMYLQPSGRGLAVATLADTTLLPELSDVEAASRGTLLRMGFPITGVVQESVKRFHFPEFVSSEFQRELDVFAEFEALQGQDGMYYTGEALAGPSVVAGLDFVQDLVQRHFT